MLSVKKVKSSGKTTDYFAKDDYYASNDPNHQQFSNWFGQGAIELGLEGYVASEAFQNILEGILPNKQRIGINKGTGQKLHDPGRDLSFSAPKSVSVMALVYGDKRLIDAHNQAVKKALTEIERNYFKTRVKVDGQIYLESTGKIVSAIFRHELSRDLDPQLHSHAIIANLTRIGDGNWRTGYFDQIYDNRNFLGSIYRAELAVLVKQLGYEIEHKGKECLFELKEIPESLLKFFSNRSIAIRAAAGDNPTQKELERATILTRKNKQIQEHDHNLYGNWLQAAHDFLAKEKIKFTPEFHSLSTNPQITQITKENSEFIQETAISAVDFAIKHLSERKTVFTRQELIAAALNDNLAKTTHAQIETAISHFVKNATLLPTQRQLETRPKPELIGANKADLSATFTTTKMLAKENAIIDLMIAGKNQYPPIIKDFKLLKQSANPLYRNPLDSSIIFFSPNSRRPRIAESPNIPKQDFVRVSRSFGISSTSYSSLNLGQKQSAELILTSKDMVVGIQGYAGVGKTYMLKFVNETAKNQGYEIIGLSPTRAATQNLEQKAGIESITLQKFLLQYDGVAQGRGTKDGRIKMQQDFKNKIVVVDEASMISTTQMKNLLTIAKDLNFKLVLVGDRKQLDSVEAGVPFFELQRNGMALAQMKEIIRQNNQNLKSAIYDVINGKIDDTFKKIDYDVITTNSITKTAIQQFLAFDEKTRQNTLILTPANETRTAINQELSNLLFEERKQELEKALSSGILSTSISSFTQKIYQNKNLTEIEKTRVYRFKPQDVIFFTKDRKFINAKKNTYAEIIATDVKNNLITIKTDNRLLSTNKSFNPEKLKGEDNAYFEVFTKSERIFKIGDKIAFNRSIPELKLINGTNAIITKITKSRITGKTSQVSLQLENNKIINLKADSSALKHIDHTYAITAHKAQGLTCQNVIAVCESYRKALTSQKNFYVEISRAKERAIIITDNQEKTIKQLKLNTGIEISAREHQGILSIRAQERQKQQQEESKVEEIKAKNTSKAEISKQQEEKEEEKAKEAKQPEPKTKTKKYLSPAFSKEEIKGHFLNAIKSGITLDAKDINSAIDRAFNKLSTKIRFGQKKEYEICWHGEAGYVKNYRTDEIIKWGVKSIKLEGNFNHQNQNNFRQTPQDEELKAKQAQIAHKNQQIEQQKTQKEQEIAKKAQKIFASNFKSSLLNTSKNQYLVKKGINRHIFKEIKFDKDNRIVVPLRNSKGEIQSLQFINQEGKKTFLAGGKKQGNFFAIDQEKIKDTKEIYLTEGFATAASIHIATNKPVVVCFDASNIEPVLKNLKETHPDKKFIIAADNDLWKEHNIGKQKAELAAQKHGAKVILPNFTLAHKDKMPTDFNDLHKISGINEVKRQIESHHFNQQIEHQNHLQPSLSHSLSH